MYQDEFEGDYGYNSSPIVYSVNAWSSGVPSADQVDPETVAERAAPDAIGMGNNGLSPSWALNDGNIDPQDTSDPNGHAMQVILSYTDGAVYPTQLQTVASMTQYCWNSTYDGSSYTYYNDSTQRKDDNFCLPYSDLTSQRSCMTSAHYNDCKLSSYTPPTYLGDCSAYQVQEVAYLAQKYYGATELEIYHSDLDDTTYVPSDDGPPDTTGTLQGIDGALFSFMNPTVWGDVVNPSSTYLTNPTCAHH